MMQTMRRNTRVIMFIVVAAFVLLIFFQWGLDVTGISKPAETTILKIDGQEVSYSDYVRFVQQKEQENRNITRDEIWAQLVDELTWQRLVQKERIRIVDDEIWAIIRNNPPPQIYNSEYMKNEQGEFDFQKYLSLIRQPESRQWLAQYEYTLRRELPREKIRSMLSTMGWVSPFEDSLAMARQTGRYDISFLSLPLFRMRGQVALSTEDVRRYYEENIKEFIVPESRIFRYVLFLKQASAEDTAEARARLEDVLLRLQEGEDFTAVAQEVSDDTIVTRHINREPDLPDHQRAVFKALRNGGVSPVYAVPQGFEVMKRVKNDEFQLIQAKVTVSMTTVEELYDRIESFKETFKEVGFDAAAQEFGLEVRKTYPLSVEKATFPVRNPEAMTKYVRESKPGVLGGPFASPAGYYVFALDSVIPQRKLDFAENEQMVRARMERKHLKDALARYLTDIEARLAGGMTMEQIAAQDTLLAFQKGLKGTSLLEIQAGYGPEFAGAVANLNPGQTGRALVTDWAGYIIRCDARQVMPFDSTMTRVMELTRESRLQAVGQILFTPKKITDNRDQFFE